MNAQILNGRYRIDAEIGRGGMGVVYRAQDLQHIHSAGQKSLRLKNSTNGWQIIREDESK